MTIPKCPPHQYEGILSSNFEATICGTLIIGGCLIVVAYMYSKAQEASDKRMIDSHTRFFDNMQHNETKRIERYIDKEKTA